MAPIFPNYLQLRAIESEPDIRRAQAMIADVVEEPGRFKPEWVQQHRWTVAPVASSDHFDRRDITLLAAAFRLVGQGECLAVATEPLENVALCYWVSTTEEGLREFNTALGAFFFVLIPECRSCAVLCTKDDYYLIGGPSPFIASALGSSIAEARTAFAAFAENTLHPTMREILRGISETYKCT